MKKIVALLLVLVLLSGCSLLGISPKEDTKGDETKEDTKGDETKEDTKADETKEEPKEEDPKVDQGKPLNQEDEDFRERFEKTKPSEATLNSLWDFTEKSFEKLREEKNRFYSPLSLYYALGMLQEGAEGKTLEEIKALLGEEVDLKTLAEHLTVDSKTGKVQLANSLWTQKGFALKEDFTKVLKEKYNAQGKEVDLATQAGMDEITKWIAAQTNNLIEPTFQPDESYRLVLVNTLYLKSAWHTPFEESNTKKDVFHGKEDQEIPFMQGSGEQGEFVKKDKFTLATKTLSEGSKMIFALPEEGVELKDLKLSDVMAAMKETSPARINWSMPKLDLSDDLDLNSSLETLGMKEAFSDKATFSKISEEELFVSLIKQYTKLKLDEKGAEAAAATVIDMATTSAPVEDIVEMKLNRPYLLIILHRDVPLFVGQIYDPAIE